MRNGVQQDAEKACNYAVNVRLSPAFLIRPFGAPSPREKVLSVVCAKTHLFVKLKFGQLDFSGYWVIIKKALSQYIKEV